MMVALCTTWYQYLNQFGTPNVKSSKEVEIPKAKVPGSRTPWALGTGSGRDDRTQ
jgi:hypothetical protein